MQQQQFGAPGASAAWQLPGMGGGMLAQPGLASALAQQYHQQLQQHLAAAPVGPQIMPAAHAAAAGMAPPYAPQLRDPEARLPLGFSGGAGGGGGYTAYAVAPAMQQQQQPAAPPPVWSTQPAELMPAEQQAKRAQDQAKKDAYRCAWAPGCVIHLAAGSWKTGGMG